MEMFSNAIEIVIYLAVLNMLIDILFGINLADSVKRFIDKIVNR